MVQLESLATYISTRLHLAAQPQFQRPLDKNAYYQRRSARTGHVDNNDAEASRGSDEPSNGSNEDRTPAVHTPSPTHSERSTGTDDNPRKLNSQLDRLSRCSSPRLEHILQATGRAPPVLRRLVRGDIGWNDSARGAVYLDAGYRVDGGAGDGLGSVCGAGDGDDGLWSDRVAAGTVCWECGLVAGESEVYGIFCYGTFLLCPEPLGYGSAKREQKEKEFFDRIRRFRVDPSANSIANPVPDYYGEKIGSVQGYRQWLKDQRAYNRKKRSFIL